MILCYLKQGNIEESFVNKAEVKDSLAVAQYARGKGIARKLLKIIQTKAVKNRIYSIKLMTDRQLEAYQMYRHIGFKESKKMLAKRAYCDRQVDYYILRVSSQNQHSKHVIEKLGGVLDNSEDLFFNRLLCALKDRFEGESYEKLRKMVKEELLADEEEVYQYKYYPESFLK